MSIETSIICDECKGRMDEGDDVYCHDCVSIRMDYATELEEKISSLEDEIIELEITITELEKEK